MSSRQDGLHRTAPQELLGFVLTVAAGAIEKAGGLVASAGWLRFGLKAKGNDVMTYPSRIAVFIVVVALVFGSMVALQKMLGVIAYTP